MRFTYGDYSDMMRQFLDRGYRFVSFKEAHSILANGGDPKFVILRHDIDFDLGKALEMALRDRELGIRSTFFFLIRTGLYNIFSAEGTRMVMDILSTGAMLGVHFDCAAYGDMKDPSSIASAVRKEAKVLEEWFGRDVVAVSFHRPRTNPLVMGAGQDISTPFIHTYMKEFIDDQMYLADSRGVWAYGEPLMSERFRQGKPLHILTHPLWWNENEIGRDEVLDGFVARRSDSIKSELKRNCTVYVG
jgi:hypothetical protein